MPLSPFRPSLQSKIQSNLALFIFNVFAVIMSVYDGLCQGGDICWITIINEFSCNFLREDVLLEIQYFPQARDFMPQVTPTLHKRKDKQ